MTKPDRPILISRQRVEDYFPGLSPKTLANLNCKGEGPTPYRKNRIIYYKTEDLESYVMGRSK